MSDIELPLIDDSTIIGLTIGAESSVDLGTIEGGVAFGPLLLEANPAESEVFFAGEALPGTFNREFREQMGDIGSFKFTIHRDDLGALTFDDTIQFQVQGVPAFLGVVKDMQFVTYSSAEGSGQVVNVSGPGALAEWNRGVVYPSRGIESLPIETTRSFSWVAPDYDEVDTWDGAKFVNDQQTYAATGTARPSIWPDTTGQWIWADRGDVGPLNAPEGICLFRTNGATFELEDPETVRVFAAFDAIGRIYIDGAEVSSDAFTLARYIEIELGVGEHHIAAKVANNIPKPGVDNPAGFMAIGYTVGSDGLLGDKLFETDTTWRCMDYPVRAPGFPHGKVIRLLHEEAVSEQDALSDWTLDFTDDVDSSGSEWGFFREVSTQVGRNYTDVIREMSDAFIDVAVAAGEKVLRVWNRGGRGTVRDVTLQQTDDPNTSDFLSLSHTGRWARMNRALIRYAEGHIEETVPDSITAFDGRTDYLELGHIDGVNEAREIAQRVMELRSVEAFATVAHLAPHTSCVPYVDFEVGDTITCPDHNDENQPMRVLGITMQEDEHGIVTWMVELQDLILRDEERLDAWLRRVAAGYSVGGARVSSPAGTPAPSAQMVTVLNVAEFSFDTQQLVTSFSPVHPCKVSANLVEIVGELAVAGSTETEVEVRLNGATLATLTFPAGETEARAALEIVAARANVDKLQTFIITPGTDAKGLDVQVRGL